MAFFRMGTRVSMMLSALTYTLYMSQVQYQLASDEEIFGQIDDISSYVYIDTPLAIVPEQLLHLRGVRPSGSGRANHLDGTRHLFGKQLKAGDNHQAPFHHLSTTRLSNSLCQKEKKFEFFFVKLVALEGWYRDPTKRFQI